MTITNTYEPHSCLDGLELLAMTTPREFDLAEYLAAVERVHLECKRCTPGGAA